MKSRFQLFQIVAAASAAFGMVSCNSDGDEADVLVRDLSEEEQKLNIIETSAERFRYRATTTQAESASAAHGGASQPQLVYETPEGWTVLESAMMRDVNLSFGENGESVI